MSAFEEKSGRSDSIVPESSRMAAKEKSGHSAIIDIEAANDPRSRSDEARA